MAVEENLKKVDVIVIVSLWALQFLDNWLQTLFEHTSRVIFGDFMESEFFEWYAVYLLFGKCALACLLALIVDAYNHKFVVAFGGMALYILTPVFALCMVITQKRIFSLLTLAASSILFVTSPAAFGVIFNQKKTPVRVQVRRLVSIMEFAEGLLLIIIGEAVPEKAAHNQRYSMVVSWVVIIPFFIFVLTILERIRKYVSSEKVREKGIDAIFKGIQNDIQGKKPNTGLSKMNFLFFVLLLFPAFSLTSLGSVVANLKSENDTQFQNPSLKKTIKFGQLTVIPICEVAVSFSPLKELLAEMLVLGLAHVLNIGVLTFLVVRMNTGRGGKQRSVIGSFYEEFPQNTALSKFSLLSRQPSSMEFDNFEDKGLSELVRIARALVPPPDVKRFVYYIINPTNINVTLEDDPPFTIFDPIHTTFIGPATGVIYGDVNMTDKELTILIMAKPQPVGAAPPFTKTIKFEEKKLYFLILDGNSTKLDIVIAGDDVDIPKIIRKPILLVQNTFVGGAFWGKHLEDDHELTVTTSTGSTIYIEILPDRKQSLSLVVPEGRLTLTMRYIGRDPIIRRKLPVPIVDEEDIEPFTVNVVTIIVKPNGNYRFKSFTKIFEKKPPPTTPAPPEPEEPDAAMQTTYAMIGATIGLTSVGYIHFFWMGCPIRLRATMYAWFLASNEILGWTAAYVVGHEIGVEEGIGLLTMAVVTAVWHFVFGWYYEHKIMPEALQKRRAPSSASISLPE